MKKTLLLSILAIACMLIGFTSCDPKAKKQETTEITTSSLNAGQEMGIVKISLTISALLKTMVSYHPNTWQLPTASICIIRLAVTIFFSRLR